MSQRIIVTEYNPFWTKMFERETKIKLTEKYPDDIAGYCDGKDKFVKQLEKEVLKWMRNE